MPHRRAKVCAHRGASGTHAENTDSAFIEAVRVGADMIEFDVSSTADDRFVVIHDATVDRTTNGSGRVAEMTFDQLRRLEAGDGQRIPSLEEAVAYAHHTMLNIHARCRDDQDADRTAEALAACFRNGLCHGRAFVAASDQTLLQRVRSRDPEIRLCNLHGQDDLNYLQIAMESTPCEVLQPRPNVVTSQFVDAAHERGLKVNPFFADDEAEMRRMIECGVDGILTNYPVRLINVRESM